MTIPNLALTSPNREIRDRGRRKKYGGWKKEITLRVLPRKRNRKDPLDDSRRTILFSLESWLGRAR